MEKIELHQESILILNQIDKLTEDIGSCEKCLNHHAGIDTDYLKSVADNLNAARSECHKLIDRYNEVLVSLKFMNYEV